MNTKRYNSINEIIEENRGKSIEEIAREPWEGPHLISVDELRAAGALDVPPSWRTSLGVERGLLFDLFADEETRAKEQPASDAEDAE